jgi:hypothetical protein
LPATHSNGESASDGQLAELRAQVCGYQLRVCVSCGCVIVWCVCVQLCVVITYHVSV